MSIEELVKNNTKNELLEICETKNVMCRKSWNKTKLAEAIMVKTTSSSKKSIKTRKDETIIYNITYTHVIYNFSFGNLPKSEIIEIFKDGRAFSHFIEPWLAFNYSNLHHVKGCKKHDHVDTINENIKYDQKTFTQRGCKFMPSNMIGQGRKFNQEIFKEKAKNLIYIIVSNINFPEIKVKFVRGIDLLVKYPKGVIQLKDFDKFFN